MNRTQRPISPLRQRMIDDMCLRKLQPTTQIAYLRSVEKLARFLGHPPDTATADDLRRFQLQLVEDGTSSVTINATITGLRFFFEVTLDSGDTMKKMSHVYQPRKIPEILNVDEVAQLLKNAGCLKYRAALGVAYGAGLRASEVCHLTTGDIDSNRMVLRVEQGKGRRDRLAILSPVLLEMLRAWWREGRAKRQLLPGGWLFPGQDPVNPLTTRSLNRIFHQACDAAGIRKRVSLHSLRHAFATHLLDRHEDIRVIQVLLGHKKIENTARYTQVATELLNEVKGPLEYLPLESPG